jgi:hypothetical protein
MGGLMAFGATPQNIPITNSSATGHAVRSGRASDGKRQLSLFLVPVHVVEVIIFLFFLASGEYKLSFF